MNTLRRHENYRSFGTYASFADADADAELRAYWQSCTPQERMAALEDLRVARFGEEAINSKVKKIFGAIEPFT